MENMGVVYGHRGAPAEYPENTLAGFRRALELGVEGIELDVHLSKDGVPVVIHDETVDRTTNGTGAVADLTVEELRKLDAGDGEYVPTLAEVLDLVGDTLRVDIEVKANAAGEAVLQEVKGRDTRWLISSFDWDVLRYVRSVDKEAEIWVLAVGASDDALAVVDEVAASALAIWQRALDEDVAKMLIEKSIPFWPWTVNDPEHARQLMEWGAFGICTDDPAGIQKALEG
jgi:glycerophosphoryl diester phosphodiesterase